MKSIEATRFCGGNRHADEIGWQPGSREALRPLMIGFGNHRAGNGAK